MGEMTSAERFAVKDRNRLFNSPFDKLLPLDLVLVIKGKFYALETVCQSPEKHP